MARAGRIARYSIYLAIVSLVGVIALWEAYDDARLNLKRGAWHWTLAEKPTITYGMAYGAAYGARIGEQTVGVLTANFSNPATAAQAFSQVERIKVPLQYDRCGMRSATPERGHSNDQAIALSGDLFMWGSENAYETTLQARLENALPFDIVNLAIRGSNSRYYADAARYFQECTGRQNFVAAVASLYVDMSIGDIPRFVARDVFGAIHDARRRGDVRRIAIRRRETRSFIAYGSTLNLNCAAGRRHTIGCFHPRHGRNSRSHSPTSFLTRSFRHGATGSKRTWNDWRPSCSSSRTKW